MAPGPKRRGSFFNHELRRVYVIKVFETSNISFGIGGSYPLYSPEDLFQTRLTNLPSPAPDRQILSVYYNGSDISSSVNGTFSDARCVGAEVGASDVTIMEG